MAGVARAGPAFGSRDLARTQLEAQLSLTPETVARMEELIRLPTGASMELVANVLQRELPAWSENPGQASTILEALCLRGEAGLCLPVLRCMQSRDIRMTPLTLNRCLAACATSPSQQWQAALCLLRGASAFRLAPTRHCYLDGMLTFSRATQWAMALALLNEMEEISMERDSVTYTRALGAYSVGMQWPSALALLNEMSVMQDHLISKSHYRICIGACRRGERWPVALALLQNMRSKRILQGIVDYSMVIETCGSNPVGQKLFLEGLQLGIFPDLLSRGRTQLELHHLGTRAAVHAVTWWLVRCAPALIKANPTITTLRIITGRGNNREEWSTSDLRAAVSNLLDAMGVPHVYDMRNDGLWVILVRDLLQVLLGKKTCT